MKRASDARKGHVLRAKSTIAKHGEDHRKRNSNAWCLLLLSMICFRAEAQQAGYGYDLSGNLVSLNTNNESAVAFIAPPQSQLLEPNAPIGFSVVAAGPGLSYQWLSNGVPIAGATGDSLVLKNLSGTNFASYRVIISNGSGSITSAPVAIWPDSNGTGMPDWWQMQYFGNLNQLPTGDFDNDGVENLAEYFEGTNPTNAASYNPRLYVQSPHGSVTASPAQPYYTMGQVVTLTAIPDSGQMFLGWTGDGFGPKPAISVLMNSHKSIGASFGLPLPLALDNSNFVWTTGGSAPWYGQTEISHDGLGSAQSGFILYLQQSWLQGVANLSQPMQFGFWWSVSSQTPDGLAFSIDGAPGGAISGTSGTWQHVQTNLPAGAHTFLWTYSKPEPDDQNGTSTAYANTPWADAAWVDEVVLTPLNTQTNAPVLTITFANPNTVTISWPSPSTGFALQQTATLAPPNWVSAPAPTDNGIIKYLAVSPATNNMFYRLVR
jgi:hypothetical protein